MKNIDLTGKTAVVTGGGQGIGLATVKSLHAAGANVVINYFPDGDGANQGIADKSVAELGERTMSAGADVRNPDQMNEMVKNAVAKFGSMDIMVNNAGILRDRSFKKMSQSEWQDVNRHEFDRRLQRV